MAEGPVALEAIRALQHGAGFRYLDLTPVLLLVAAGLVAARFVALGHNTIRGAAGASILNAELLKAQGFLD